MQWCAFFQCIALPCCAPSLITSACSYPGLFCLSDTLPSPAPSLTYICLSISRTLLPFRCIACCCLISPYNREMITVIKESLTPIAARGQALMGRVSAWVLTSYSIIMCGGTVMLIFMSVRNRTDLKINGFIQHVLEPAVEYVLCSFADMTVWMSAVMKTGHLIHGRWQLQVRWQRHRPLLMSC